MYAVYNYAAGSTQANVLSDLIKLITGETNKANLSANCVQANTSITSTVAAGWTVWDAAAGTNQQVVRALNQDGSTYKYYRLNVSSTAAITASIAEAWNDTAHTGTNVTSTTQITWNGTAGGYFYLYVTPRNLFLLSYSSSTWQSNQASCHEFSRDTVATGYPAFALTSGGVMRTTMYSPRVKNYNSAGDTTGAGSAILIMNADGVTGYEGGFTSTLYRDASENQLIAAYKVGVAGYTSPTGTRRFGQCYDILMVGSATGVGTNLDEIAYGGKTYVLFYGTGTVAGILVPKE